MTKGKKWYVSVELSINGMRKKVIQMMNTKLEAEKLCKQIKDNAKVKFYHIDFVWKNDFEKIPFSKLISSEAKQVESILSYLQ